jgi:hypothetical protein
VTSQTSRTAARTPGRLVIGPMTRPVGGRATGNLDRDLSHTVVPSSDAGHAVFHAAPGVHIAIIAPGGGST